MTGPRGGAGHLTGHLDKGASLNPSAPCLTTAGVSLSYAFVQQLSWRIARGLARSGVRPGDRVAVLSGNDPTAFSCVFGIARAGAVWVPLGTTANDQELADCTCLIFQASFAPLVERLRPHLPGLKTVVCLGGAPSGVTPFEQWLDGVPAAPWEAPPVADLAVRSKGALLTGHTLETLTASTLLGFPFEDRPRFLAATSMTDTAGLLSLPVLTLGGEIVLMPSPDLTDFLDLVERHRITHAFLPTALLSRLLDNITLDTADLTSLRCLFYGTTSMSPARLKEAIERIGPVLGRLYGRAKAPLVLTTLAPADHFRPDGSLAVERLSSTGKPGPLTQLSIVDCDGRPLPPGAPGEVAVRVAGRDGWWRTGDRGHLDDDGYLYLVDRPLSPATGAVSRGCAPPRSG